MSECLGPCMFSYGDNNKQGCMGIPLSGNYVKIVTPGTMNQGLNDKENNYIGAITFYNKEYVLSYSDMSTGEGYVATYHAIDVLLNDIISLKHFW